MFLLGLTGDIACGKSTVARLLQERGAFHIDADELVRELYADRDFARDLQTHLRQFSAHRVLDNADTNIVDANIVDANGAVDRRALSELVFADATLLRELEARVHPAVAQLRERKLAPLRALPPPQVVVLEAVKLVESGQARDCDFLWWICASHQTQLQRLTQNRGWSQTDAQARLRNQPSPEAKQKLLQEAGVPFVFLPNDGSFRELEVRVAAQWVNLEAQFIAH